MSARLTYSPKVYVYTKDQAGSVYNLSQWVVSGEVNRLINQPSTATVTLRNPLRRFTTPSQGVAFHPMDPITIYMERLAGFPVRVFTGYLDSTPYYQLFPGTITLQATCTLKRLLYTYFDPSLPFMISFFQRYGWINTGQGSIRNPNTLGGQPKPASQTTLQDSSFGKLLWATLFEIGEWQDANIYIENLPNGIGPRMAKLMSSVQAGQKQATNDFASFLNSVVGAASQGSGGGTGGGSGGTPGGVGPTGTTFGVLQSNEGNATNCGASAGQCCNGGCCSQTQYSQAGWTELSVDASGVGNALGQSFMPCSPLDSKSIPGNWMWISADLKTWHKMPQVDVGTGSQGIGSSHGLSYPAIGLTEAACSQIFGDSSASGRYCYIKLASGKTMSPPSSMANPISPTSNPATSQGNPGGSVNKGGSSPSHPSKVVRGHHLPGKTLQGTLVSTTVPAGSGNTSSALGNIFPYGTPITVERTDEGVDFSVPAGTSVGAMASGTVSVAQSDFYQNQPLMMVVLDTPINGYKAWYIAEQITPTKTSGHVSAGEQIATVASSGTGIETGWACTAGAPNANHSCGGTYVEGQQTSDGMNFANYIGVPILATNQTQPLDWSKLTPGQNTGTGGGGNTGGSTGTVQSSNAGEAFVAELQFPSIEDQVIAEALGSEHKGLMHDQSLLPFIQQLTQSSLRSFMSLPNGDFYAFYPDYFGEFGQHDPYWLIDDIEILDGSIQLTDDALATHVFAVGDNIWPVNNELLNMLLSTGSINVFNAFTTEGLLATTSPSNGTVLTYDEAVQFIQRYGARPLVQDYPMVRNNLFEMLLAYQQFMYAWSNQFRTPFSFTFMPEVFPGGKVAFPNHGLQMYVNSVTHTWDYEEGGFTTTAELSAPSLYGNGNPDLPPNMVRALAEPLAKGPPGSLSSIKQIIAQAQRDAAAITQVSSTVTSTSGFTG